MTTEQMTNPVDAPSRAITILEDVQNYNIKHPLQYHWKLYVKKGRLETATQGQDQKDTWAQSLEEAITINTVEDFWW